MPLYAWDFWDFFDVTTTKGGSDSLALQYKYVMNLISEFLAPQCITFHISIPIKYPFFVFTHSIMSSKDRRTHGKTSLLAQQQQNSRCVYHILTNMVLD